MSKAHAESIALALSRAAGVPLYLQVHRVPSNPLPHPNAIPLATVLTKIASHQLKGAYFHELTVEAVLGKVFFPTLQSLILSTFLDGDIQQSIANTFPKLERLILDYCGIEDCPPNLPWAQLTHLYIESLIPIAAIRAILSSAVNIHSAAFHLLSNTEDVEWAHAPRVAKDVTLHFLQDFTLLRYSPFHLPFSTIAWPNLTHLRIYNTADLMYWHPTNLPKFARLIYLHLEGVTNYFSMNVVIFDAAPLIKHLRVGFVEGVPAVNIFRLLKFDPLQPRLPALQHLDIRLSPFSSASGIREDASDIAESLANMISSRLDGGRLVGETEVTTMCADLKELKLSMAVSGRWHSQEEATLLKALEAYKERLKYDLKTTSSRINQQMRLTDQFKHWEDGFGDVLDVIYSN